MEYPKLTADLVEAFAGMYLSSKYDTPQPTPQFHRDVWKLYCSSARAAVSMAPRNHAKSTAFTHDFICASVCWRADSYIILIGSTEEMAIEHLSDIANEFRENEDIKRDFKIKRFIQDQKTDIIVECEDGYQFRILARGAEQKIRGRKWRNKRPGLILFDDIEDDEQVESRERRKKFRRWFFRAVVPALRDGGKIRGHGTILHEDSILNRLRRNKAWVSLCYRAHKAFNDFSDILWPEKFSEERLRSIRQEFINEGDSPGYSQEYLNDPYDHDDVYLREGDFIPMHDEAAGINLHLQPMLNFCGVDLAISKSDSANRTAFVVGGKTCDPGSLLCIRDCRSEKMDTREIVDEFFSVQARWDIEIFFVEDGQIWKSVKTILEEEMRARDTYLMIVPCMPIGDKAVRGRALQKRSRAGGMRYDTEAEWYEDYKQVLLRFSGETEAIRDDEFDGTAWLVRGVQDQHISEEDFDTEEEEEFRASSNAMRKAQGRSLVTGY